MKNKLYLNREIIIPIGASSSIRQALDKIPPALESTFCSFADILSDIYFPQTFYLGVLDRAYLRISEASSAHSYFLNISAAEKAVDYNRLKNLSDFAFAALIETFVEQPELFSFFGPYDALLLPQLSLNDEIVLIERDASKWVFWQDSADSSYCGQSENNAGKLFQVTLVQPMGQAVLY